MKASERHSVSDVEGEILFCLDLVLFFVYYFLNIQIKRCFRVHPRMNNHHTYFCRQESNALIGVLRPKVPVILQEY